VTFGTDFQSQRARERGRHERIIYSHRRSRSTSLRNSLVVRYFLFLSCVCADTIARCTSKILGNLSSQPITLHALIHLTNSVRRRNQSPGSPQLKWSECHGPRDCPE